MIEMFKQANWDAAYNVLTQGNPPLVYQMLAINSLFFILSIIRRMRGKPMMKSGPSMAIQGLLITANIALLVQDQFLPYYQSHIQTIWYKLMSVI